jgi:hypothetical protein
MARWMTGIIDGLFVSLLVFIFLAFCLGRAFEGVRFLDVAVGYVLPLLPGLIAGILSFRRSVRPEQAHWRAPSSHLA